jgi:hypothetical protein
MTKQTTISPHFSVESVAKVLVTKYPHLTVDNIIDWIKHGKTIERQTCPLALFWSVCDDPTIAESHRMGDLNHEQLTELLTWNL